MNDTTGLQPATGAWLAAMNFVLQRGMVVSPRGIKTKEILGYTSSIDMAYPIVISPARKIGYKFMAAEAAWMLSGANDVESIAPYSKNISKFSDDGKTFFGAYGPKICDQIDYIIETLIEDPDSRQAVLTIWRENPPYTKDVPCTIALQFMIRTVGPAQELFVCATMRSSDAWLGLPYDMFNFSMIGIYVAMELRNQSEKFLNLAPGRLYINAFSEHLYYQNWTAAQQIVQGFQRLPEIPNGPNAWVWANGVCDDPAQLVDKLWKLADDKGALLGMSINDDHQIIC